MYHLGDLLRSVSFFKDADTEFLHEIVPLLQFEVYLQDEVVIKGGKRGNKMFFIEHGIVEVVNASGHVTAILGKGNHFGGLISQRLLINHFCCSFSIKLHVWIPSVLLITLLLFHLLLIL